MTYISNNVDQLGVASKFIPDLDAWTAKHIFIESVDSCATQFTVSDTRCICVVAYSAVEWFDPPFAIRLAEIRHRRK